MLVVGIKELSSSSVYDVWLVTSGQRAQVSQVTVNSRGWGATTIYLDQPIFEYDAMEVTSSLAGGPGSTPRARILVGKFGVGGDLE